MITEHLVRGFFCLGNGLPHLHQQGVGLGDGRGAHLRGAGVGAVSTGAVSIGAVSTEGVGIAVGVFRG